MIALKRGTTPPVGASITVYSTTAVPVHCVASLSLSRGVEVCAPGLKRPEIYSLGATGPANLKPANLLNGGNSQIIGAKEHGPRPVCGYSFAYTGFTKSLVPWAEKQRDDVTRIQCRELYR